jgi:RNA polymerase sigma factor (sigma-70 family)
MKKTKNKLKISSIGATEVELLKTDQRMFQRMLKDNENFIHRIIHKINYNKLKDADTFHDAFQEGCIGLWNAVLSFNPEKAASFSTYSHTCITNAVLGKVKEHHRKTGKEISIESFVRTDEDGNGEYYENKFVVPNYNSNIYTQIEKKLDEEKMIKKLSKLDSEIYKMKFVEQKSLKEIYPLVGMKKGTFYLYYYKAFLPKMKKLLKGNMPWMT